MTQDTKHTPGKLEAHASKYLKFATVTIGGVAIEIRTKNSSEDALRIIRCWNSHDELVAACEALVIELESRPLGHSKLSRAAIAEGRAALGKATGKTL